eukprot:scaffold57688_cov59-Phaeocystis_antarctica.AAC.2
MALNNKSNRVRVIDNPTVVGNSGGRGVNQLPETIHARAGFGRASLGHFRSRAVVTLCPAPRGKQGRPFVRFFFHGRAPRPRLGAVLSHVKKKKKH